MNPTNAIARPCQSISFKDQSNFPPLLPVAAHDGVLEGTTLVCIPGTSDRELAMVAGESGFASVAPVAEEAAHVGVAELFVVSPVGG